MDLRNGYFRQKIPQLVRQNLMLSVGVGTVYWCLDAKGQTILGRERTQGHRGLSQSLTEVK